MPIQVLDNGVVLAAVLRGGGVARAALQACMEGHHQALLGPALLAEYEDALGRPALSDGSSPRPSASTG